MKEWSSQWNPFNSAKVLAWYDNLKKISEGNFPAPVQVDIDPTNLCNYDCTWCNATRARRCKGTMTYEQMKNIVDFISKWGVKSACVSGGGEPLMNKDTNSLLEMLHVKGIEYGIITNGYYLDYGNMHTIAITARWCGISMDAASNETYNKVKGIRTNAFEKVMKNCKELNALCKKSGRKIRCETAAKYLVHPWNVDEITFAARIARDAGFDHFHVRPVGLDNLPDGNKLSSSDMKEIAEKINDHFDAIQALETDTFKVFGVRHKFNPDFTRKVSFKKCRAIPLICTFEADGNLGICFDRRGDKNLTLCRWDTDNILEHWGSNRHKEILESIDPVKDCPRCTFTPYNEVIEQVIEKDSMCINFP